MNNELRNERNKELNTEQNDGLNEGTNHEANHEGNKKIMMDKGVLHRALLDTIPVMSGYLVLGITFGILLKNAGYGIIWALGISMFVYAGSMQYVLVTLLTSGASLLSVGLTTLMVNARHLFYGLSMIEKYNQVGKCRNYLIFALTDETYSLVCNEKQSTDSNYFLYVSMLNHFYWIIGTALGAFLGSVITFNLDGIEFAMTALFVVVVVEQWLSTKKHLPTLIGFTCSVACLIIFGTANFLIPSMILILVSLSFMQKRLGE